MGERRVLFVCVGNSCRSQMAEGFAKVYGKGVLAPASAGLAPAGIISLPTHRIMKEKNVLLADQFPKSLNDMMLSDFDLVVNISGYPLPGPCPVPVRIWEVQDPIGESDEVYRTVRDQIEQLVMRLIIEMRPADDSRAPADKKEEQPPRIPTYLRRKARQH